MAPLRGWTNGLTAALLAPLLLSACAPATQPHRPPGTPETLALTFEDKDVPGIFDRELLGRRDKPKGAQGLWASVPGLRRAERGEVTNLATGAKVTVALFNGAPAGEARLSNAAAELLGIGSTPTRVRVTVVRREPLLTAP